MTSDGKLIISGCEDGSYQLFSLKNNWSRPVLEYRKGVDMEITDIKFFKDDQRFITRASDNTMRLFDIRNFKSPVHTWYELFNNSPFTSVAISPNEEFIVTGTSNTKTKLGTLNFFYSSPGQDYKEVGRIPVAQGMVNSVIWPAELNQIIVGAGNDVKVFYDPNMSKKGA